MEVVVAWLKVLSRHLPWYAEGRNNDSWFAGWDMNPGSAEGEAAVPTIVSLFACLKNGSFWPDEKWQRLQQALHYS
jgi:hypothetical protein